MGEGGGRGSRGGQSGSHQATPRVLHLGWLPLPPAARHIPKGRLFALASLSGQQTRMEDGLPEAAGSLMWGCRQVWSGERRKGNILRL